MEPLEAIGGIEQAGFAESMHEGTMGEVVEDLVLCLLGELVALGFQPLNEAADLLADLFSCGCHEVPSNFTVLPISPAIDLFVKEKCRLLFAGTRMDNNFDLLIACTSVVNGMVMVTENVKEFKNIKGIQIENWIER